MNEKKFDEWFGVPRKEIPWYPKIDPAVCIGCGLCAVICGRGVYSYDLVDKKPVVVKPYHCLVGCQTCANLCPVGAIEFPDPQMVRGKARKHKIFTKVKKLLNEKFAAQLVETAKSYSEEISSQEKKMKEIDSKNK